MGCNPASTFDRLLALISASLAVRDGEAIQQGILQWLQRLGHRFSLAGLFLVKLAEPGHSQTSMSWSSPGLAGLDIRPEKLPLVHARLRAGVPFFARDVRRLSREGSIDSMTLRNLDLRALVSVPFTRGEDRFGIIAVKRKHPEAWPHSIVHQLRVLGTILAAALARMILESRWRHCQARLEAIRSVLQNDAALIHLQRVATISDLSSAIGHQLSRPLAAMLSNAQAASRLLQRPNPDLAVLREMVSDITNTNLQAGELLQRVHGFVRKGDPVWVLLDLNDIVRDALCLAGTRARLDGAEVRLKLSPLRLRVRGDGIQLQQVVLNLVVNAIDALRGTPDPRLVTVRTARRGTTVGVAVSDNGPGIATDPVDNVFKPFYTTKEQGLGMGLAIAKTIVVTHGGRLQARNNRNRGATVAMMLPSPEW